ncbi:MAG TPA: glycosyl hydrolase family 65 protein [Anaerolineales bacterium]
MEYGAFDDARREYVITRPDTPLPWLNYLGSDDYIGLITNTAGGYSFYQDARLRRLTRYRYNNAPLDFGGRYIYIRDNQSGDYWSPSWQPTQRELEGYSCRHGFGYSIIGSKHGGIRAETRYFVPLGQSLEVWQLTLTNQRERAANLSVFASVEFCLWDAWDDATNFQRNLSTGEVEVEDGVIYHKTEYRERRNHFAYFACSERPAGFDTDRDAFLGAYRSWDRPIVVETGQSRDTIVHGWRPIGALQVQANLEAGESRQIRFILGYFENAQAQKFDPPGSQTINKRTVRPIIARYTAQERVDAEFGRLRAFWDERLGVLRVQTPDAHVDRMVNLWNAYQCVVTFNVSRSASMFESGIGRGVGFRDSNQDLLGAVHLLPERSRQRLLDLAATQLPGGGAYHQFQPLTRRGNHDIGSGFNDDPLWLVLAVGAYLRETGDPSILDERVPYDNLPGNEETLYEHLRRAVQYTMDRLGPHGLPLIGHADWNDCLNLNTHSEVPGESFQTAKSEEGMVAESVFIAGLFVAAAREMAEITKRYVSTSQQDRGAVPLEAVDYSKLAAQMTQSVDAHGWDGEWFLRAYDSAGGKVGSAECKEGQIYIEPQGICPLAGIGLDNGLARKALDSVRSRLLSEHGLALVQPAYTRYDPALGEIASYPPGYKENGSIFCHNNPWVMIAEARTGNGEAALDYYLRINPSARASQAERHRCEPYVYAQMIAGPEAPTHGEAKNSWLTGAAAWNYVAVTQWILGIRPEYDGLRIDPCIPRAWTGFSVLRRFRGETLQITVHNPQGVTKGVVRMTVDGQEVADNLVVPAGVKAERKIDVWLGR